MVREFVARGAQRDQILCAVVAETASWLDVMNLEMVQSSATLASPTISFKNLLAKRCI